MAAYTPSVMAFQECGRELGQNLAKRAEWHFEQFHNLCLLSRWPVTQRDSMPRAAFARISDLGYGGAAIVIRYTIAHPAGPFELVNLHLETARKGTGGILGDQGLLRDDTGLPNVPASLETDRFAINADIRLRESNGRRTGVLGTPIRPRSSWSVISICRSKARSFAPTGAHYPVPSMPAVVGSDSPNTRGAGCAFVSITCSLLRNGSKHREHGWATMSDQITDRSSRISPESDEHRHKVRGSIADIEG